MTFTNLIHKAQLEELLLAHWARFVDYKKLLALVLTCVRDTEFPQIETEKIKANGTKIKLSRFELVDTRFTVWVEFTIPREQTVVIGTTELNLYHNGTTEHVQTIGTQFACA